MAGKKGMQQSVESKLRKRNLFLDNCAKVHGDRYIYDMSYYVNNNTKIPIICKKHRHLFWQLPSAHTQGQNCHICGREGNSINSRDTEQVFESKWSGVNKNVNLSYVVGSFTKYHAPVSLHCKSHGLFSKTANNVVNNPNSCPECSKQSILLKNKEKFIEKSKKLYPNQFTYEDCNYVDNTTKVILNCVQHGKFSTTPMHHVSSDNHQSGCIECARISWGRWSPKVLEKNLEHFQSEVSHLYVLQMEDFYKIGISKSLDTRIKMISDESGIPAKLILKYETNTYKASCMEHALQDIFKSQRFPYHVKFGGYTECYRLSSQDFDNLVGFFNKADSF